MMEKSLLFLTISVQLLCISRKEIAIVDVAFSLVCAQTGKNLKNKVRLMLLDISLVCFVRVRAAEHFSGMSYS